MDTPDRSASSSAKVVQDIWDDLGTVPPNLIQALWSAFDRNRVDEFWNVWSAGAEAGLLRSYQRSGGTVTAGERAFCGRGALQIRRGRLGGGAAG